MVLPYLACWLGNYESRAFQYTDFQPTTSVNLMSSRTYRAIRHPSGRNVNGLKDKNDWLCFEKAKKMTDTIFVVSAGNDGIDIDQTGIYPAALDLDNIIAVTSGDKFGRLGVA